MKRKLILETGEFWIGESFGSTNTCISRLVANNSMVGYQELITDPALKGQMILFNYPLIGNTGISDDDYLSDFVYIDGLIVKDYSNNPSNFRYTKTLSDVMEEANIPGISQVDTRMIRRLLQDSGFIKAMITDEDMPNEQAISLIKETKLKTEIIGCKKNWYAKTPNHRYNAVIIDFGVSFQTINTLNDLAFNLTIVPNDIEASTLLTMNADLIVLSNGPSSLFMGKHINLVKSLQGKVPLFAIGYGFHLLAIANDCTLIPLNNPQCGNNIAVKDLLTNKIISTSQHHLEAIFDVPSSIDPILVNQLDNSIEAFKINNDILAVQYLPKTSTKDLKNNSIYQLLLKMIDDKGALNAKKN